MTTETTATVLALRPLTAVTTENRTERRPHKGSNERGNQGVPRPGIMEQLESLIEGEVIAYPLWYNVFQKIIQKNFAMPPQILITFVQCCPTQFVESERNLALELVTAFRDMIINRAAEGAGISLERLEHMLSRMKTYLQLAGFYGAKEYLDAYTTVLFFHKKAGVELPEVLLETMDKCAGFHRGRGNFTIDVVMAAEYNKKEFVGDEMRLINSTTGDHFSFPCPVGEALVSELEALGYEMKRRDANQGVWVHPTTKQQRTVHFPAAREGKVTGDGKKLTGVALLDEEGIKKAQEAKAARHAEALKTRRQKKAPPQKAEKKDKKESKKNKK